MYSKLLTLALVTPTIVLAIPAQDVEVESSHVKPRANSIFQDYGGELDDDGNKVSKRDGLNLEQRNSDYISSCGDEWVPVGDFYNNRRRYIGYETAVDLFCTHITSDFEGQPAVIGPKAYAGTTITTNDVQDQVGIDNGKDPAKSVTPGHIEFEIHNKQKKGSHTPTIDNCKTYLMKMARAGQSCYGKKHKDSKGGTYQIGSDDISYHALPSKG
ncbi:hypothetical protein F4677DRAFT_458787 [Hypoxylon crocopeplum]|nr:hypothetical protein F4677DRAFT_458787 [Hypoxylon crocopeplum]